MKLLVEEITDFEVLVESSNGQKNHYIQGPFMQWGIPNRNGRMYPKQVMEAGVGKYLEDFVSKNRAVGTLGHEDTPKISENKVSHIVTNLEFKGNDVWGKAKVLETTHGKELKALIEGGVSFGCSSRALGSLKEENGIKIVQPDFTIACVDAVLQPSGISCWVDGIMENADWVFVNGQGWVQEYKEESRNTLRKTKRADIERVALQIFENYINRL